MSADESRLAEIRALRDAAKARLDARLARARVDLTPAAIKQRVVTDAKVKAMRVATEAVEIATDNRGVVVGTVAALTLWLGRKPLGRAAFSAWEGWREAREGASESLLSRAKTALRRLREE